MDKYIPKEHLFDYFDFVVDRRFENESESGIIIINESYISGGENEEAEGQINHRRIYGDVISVPRAFSGEKVMAIDPGLPSPKRYISGDEIAEKIKMGMRSYSKSDYSPATFAGPKYITLKKIGKKTDIRVGDRIYVDYKATAFDQHEGMRDGKDVFKVRVDEVICVVRDEKIISQGGWTLIRPHKETWEDITSEGGIITKLKPENIPLEGFVIACDFTEGIAVGDKIVYQNDADWIVKIEGEEIFAIQERDILSILTEECVLCDGSGRRVFRNCTPPVDEPCPACNTKRDDNGNKIKNPSGN